jgi:hypothetical protein
MNELPRGLGYEDLPDAGDVAPAELATSLRTGRDLEAYAASEHADFGPDFIGRVMEAIAAEPAPQPAVAAGRAILAVRPMAVLSAVRDAWRVAFSGGRPALVRAQAMVVVLVAVVALAGIGGAATIGALALLDRGGPEPSPTAPLPSPTIPPSMSPPPSPSPTPGPIVTPSPTPTPSQTAEPTDTEEPTETPEGTDDNSGPGGGGDDDSAPTSDNSGSGSENSGSDD